MKLLVTGATGFVGSAVVAEAQARGHSVRGLARSVPAVAEIELVPASVAEPAGLVRACQGCDAVIHLVGIIAEAGPQTYGRIHVEGTRHMVSAARAAGVPRFIHMSALGTRPEGRSRYHRTKWLAEELVRASGLAWTIFRPSVIHGPGDGFVGFFERISRWSPFLPVIGEGRGLLQPVAVGDVARCFVAAAGRPETAGRCFDLCGPDRLEFVEVLSEILSATRRRRLRIHLPLSLARIQARFLEALYPAVFRRPPPLNRDQILMLGEDNVGDPAPATREFDLRPLPFREALRRDMAMSLRKSS